MPGQIQSIERAAAVLRLLGARMVPLGLSEVSNGLELPKGTAHGILRTLVEVGFVEQDRDNGKYALGEGFRTLGSHYLDTNEVRARSLNWADPLAARTGEAVHVGVARDTEVEVVHHVFRPDSSPQTLDVGALLPFHATALGRVLLAYDPHAEQSLPKELARFTNRTETDRRRLAYRLSEIRSRGHATEIGEFVPDLAGLAAPIHGYGGLVVAAVGIFGPPDRICDTAGRPREKLVALVTECARSIARELMESRAVR